MSNVSTGATEDGAAFAIGLLSRVKQTFLDFSLFITSGFILFPLYLLVLTSLKSRNEIFGNPLALPDKLMWENYVNAWQIGGFDGYFFNSVLVVGTAIVLIVVCSSLAAYALVRFDFSADKLVLLFILAGFMIPPQVLVIPLYTIMNQLNLLNTYIGVIIPYVAFGLPFSIFLLRQFFVNIPPSYAEAAKMDGCSELQIFTRIYLPLSIPALTSVAVFQFIFLWNEFLYALVFLTDNSKRTLPAGLMAFQGQNSGNWPALFAGIVIAIIPTVIFFMIFQKQFVRGATAGSGVQG